MKPDIQTMRLAVARMLPNEIKIESGYTYDPKSDVATSCEWGAWLDTGRQINDREWLHIAFLAEQTLTGDEWLDYVTVLYAIACNQICGRPCRQVVCASADQRIEALCRYLHPEMFKP